MDLSDDTAEPHFATVDVSVTATDDAHVTSFPLGIDCPAVRCSAPFALGATLRLISADGRRLVWGAPCSTTSESCQVPVNGTLSVTVSDAPGDP